MWKIEEETESEKFSFFSSDEEKFELLLVWLKPRLLHRRQHLRRTFSMNSKTQLYRVLQNCDKL